MNRRLLSSLILVGAIFALLVPAAHGQAPAFAQAAARAELDVQVPSVVGRSIWKGQTNPNLLLHVSVSLLPLDAQGLQMYADGVSNPNSPIYREFLTPEQVGAQFGQPLEAVNQVADYLRAQGFKIRMVAKNRLAVLADATVAQAEAAFATRIDNFDAINPNEPGNPHFYSFSQPLQVPAPLKSFILDVTGLENFTKPLLRTTLTPTQTRTLYNLAPAYNAGMNGQGRTVGISNWDGFRLTNVPLYYSKYGLPSPPGGVSSNITVITISGGSGGGPVGVEGDLDIQMVLGMAPLCNFRIYDGGSNDLIGVLTAEANDNLSDAISESYGWSLSSSTAFAAHNQHLSMTAQGITYMAASGDSGTKLEPYSYPNYDPEVLMVGGTVASVDTSGNRISEVGWSGSGGGWSTNTATFNILPAWQVGNGVPTNINHRLSPDVALHSSGTTSNTAGAYFFYLNGALTGGYIGTSFASPVFAGSLAVAEQKIISLGGLPANAAGKQRFGRMQDLIYAQNGRSDVWLDITSGSNGTLPNGSTSNAGPGWDYVTGWGPINWDNFVSTQVSATPDFSLSATPASQTVAAGSGTTYTAAVTPANGFSETVTFSVSGLPSGASGSFSPTTVPGSGSSILSVNTTSAVAAGTYTLTITGTGTSKTHSTTVSLVVTQPDFSISATPASQTVAAGSGTSYTTTVTPSNGFSETVNFSVTGLPSGASGSFSPTTVSGSGNSTLSVTTTTAVAAGTYTLTITGTSPTKAHSTTVSLVVTQPDFSISATPASQTVAAGGGTTYTTTVSPSGGFSETVTFSVTGLPSGATGSFNPASVAGGGNSTLTVTTSSTTPAGSYTLTITGTGTSKTHSTTVTLVVSQPDFSLSDSPTTVNVSRTRGNTGTSTITVTPVASFNGTVGLSVSGVPTGVTASFIPTSITGGSGSSVLSLTASPQTPKGSYTLTVTGVSGTLSHTTTITLKVNK